MKTAKANEKHATPETVWAILQEIAEQQKEFREGMKELREAQKELREAQKETDQKFKETDRQMKETDRQMKETDRKIGEMSNRFGELAEHLVAPGIAKRFNELGHHYDGIYTRGYEIADDNRKIVAEVDILLDNSDSIMAVEVKSKPRMQDIPHHVRRIELLRKMRERRGEKQKRIFGAIAGAVFGTEEKQAAIDAGFYVLVQSGDTMMLDIPDGFVPVEW